MADITCFQQAHQILNDVFNFIDCLVNFMFLFFYGSQVQGIYVVYFCLLSLYYGVDFSV